MSPDKSESGAEESTSSASTVDTDETPEKDTPPGEDGSQNMHELLGELRAEITRLKAHRAKEQAQNWIQRHPMLAVSLSAAVGATVGYGTALMRRPQPPTLSEQARHRLRQLAREARRVAGDVGQTLSERASRSGQEARKRLQESGQQLARQVQEATKQEAEELAHRASEQAQQMGAGAGEVLRRAAKKASEQVRKGREAASEEVSEMGAELAEEAKEAIEDSAESVQQRVYEAGATPSLKRSLWTMAGLAAGGYLAAKVRRWL